MKLKKINHNNTPMTQTSDTTSSCKKEEKVGKWSGLTRSELLGVIVQSILVCAVIVSFSVFFYFMFKDLFYTVNNIGIRDIAVEEAYDGIIVDKCIENSHSNAFRTTPTEYRLYINVDYELNGEKMTTKKYFSVPASTYLAYNIGDYFNSRDFFISDEQ